MAALLPDIDSPAARGSALDAERPKGRFIAKLRHELLSKAVKFSAVGGIALCAATVANAAAAPRLALWVTEAIGASNAEHCRLAAVPATTPTLTDDDVTAWNPDDGRWTLSAKRFPPGEAAQRLRDRCFVLALDGQVLSSGVVLSSFSARLLRLPSLTLHDNGHGLQLQLSAGYPGSLATLIHRAALQALLGQPANLERQQQRLTRRDDPVHLRRVSDEWADAVQALIERMAIRPGLSLVELRRLLGEPSHYPRGYSGPHLWRLDTTSRPEFRAEIQDGVVRTFELQRH